MRKEKVEFVRGRASTKERQNRVGREVRQGGGGVWGKGFLDPVKAYGSFLTDRYVRSNVCL